MITRAKKGIFKPKIYNATIENEEPCTYHQAIQCEKWKSAMNEEFEALQRNRTWDLVPLPCDKNIIGCKWIFRLKKKF